MSYIHDPRFSGLGPSAEQAREEQPLRPRKMHPDEIATLVGCLLSSFAVLYLVFFRLAPMTGAIGFFTAWFLLFLPMYWFVVRQVEGKLAARARVMSVVVTTGALLLLIPLVLVIGYVIWKGWQGITWAFFTKTLATAGPNDPYSAGGAAHAIVGTIEQVALAIMISVPLGLICAVFLNEIGGPLHRPVRIFVDAMSGVPTIVAGLFIYAVWEVTLGHGFSGFAAAMAISISMLPVITRTAEEVLRLVPDGLREASLALGTSEARTTWGVVLPTARAGLVTAVILGVARAVGETAPLIMTSFGSSVMNANPFSGAQASLPIFIFRNISFPYAASQQRAWTGALVLMTIVLVLFTTARVLANRQVGGKTRAAAPAASSTAPGSEPS